MDEKVKGLIGLGGVLVACMAVDLNSQVTSVAAPDIQGALGLSHDPASWLTTLYVGGEAIGMAITAWFALTFGMRRYLLGVIALDLAVSIVIPPLGSTPLLFPLRAMQGLVEGLTVPLLMAIALRVLPPSIRLYGLAAYALTATVFPYLGASLAAFWLDDVGWSFTFLQVVPMCALAAVLVWFGIPDLPPKYERFRKFNGAGLLLIIVAFGSLAIILTQGDRLDWFNSQMITLFILTAVISLPLLVINELSREVPFLKFQMLRRPNFAFGSLGLFLFLLVSLGALELPAAFLREAQGFRPLQTQGLTLLVASAQILMLPAMALLLDRAWVDARVVALVGLSLMFVGALGDSFLDETWQAREFFGWQALMAFGAPMVVMPLLMTATNAVLPDEGPFASALINTPRALAEMTAIWLVIFIQRARGAFHTARLTDSVGSFAFGHPLPPEAAAGIVAEQSAILSTADAFRIVAGIAALMMLVVLLLPRRTYPPRIALAGVNKT